MDWSTAQANFRTAFTFIKGHFYTALLGLDEIYLFGNFSVLDFWISILILGAILPVVIVTVQNWSGSSAVHAAKSSRARKDNDKK